MATELQKKKWSNMFKMFDVNGDGQIQQSDLDQFNSRYFEMRGLEPGSPKYDELNRSFAEFGQTLQQATDAKSITLDNWLAFLTNVAATPEMYQVVRTVSEFIFTLLDENGDGKVSINEYRKLCSVMRLGEGYADKMFAKLDLNHDEFISLDELLKLSDQFFVGDDPDAPGNLFFGPV